jgi:hypothetical protein
LKLKAEKNGPVKAASCGMDAMSHDPKLMMTSPGLRPANRKMMSFSNVGFVDRRGDVTCVVCKTVRGN